MVLDGNDNPVAVQGGEPGDYDESIPGGTSVIAAINRCRTEAEDGRRSRMDTNDSNWDMYLGRQDWSHKQDGQSTEVLPKVPVSVEQLAAIVKRGMVQFGSFYEVQLGGQLAQNIDGAQVQSLLDVFLDDLWAPNNKKTNLPTVISDAVKQALLKSLIILKVHGSFKTERRFVFERGDDKKEDSHSFEDDELWKLRVDVVRAEDYYPDPTGSGLYEIHRVERDLHEVEQMAEEGIYDKAAVKQLRGTMFTRPDDEELSDNDRNQDETTEPSFRKRVMLDEFWGTLLDDEGRVAHRNVVATVANEQFLIRPPEPNPYWHQESPFIAEPLVRVPFSVWHKALFDHASDLNRAINELFNLMIDGSLAAVWGVRQIRLDDMEDPSQAENGIKQGATIAVKQTLPHGQKVVEQVTEGEVPQEAMAMFEALNSEFMQASLTNELKMGALPPRQVLATEVLESSQSQNLMLDGIVGDLENNVITRCLRMCFLNVLQMANTIPETSFSGATDRMVALLIMRSSPEERYSMFINKCNFKVNGLSTMMTRALDFQKVMALLQALRMDPALMQEFQKKYSPSKMLKYLYRVLGMNPDHFAASLEEQSAARQGQMQQGTNTANQFIQGGPENAEGQPAGVASGPGTGGDPTTAAIQQQANPATGMPMGGM
jgi:hypothetical protein